jgi:hypothetical protein
LKGLVAANEDFKMGWIILDDDRNGNQHIVLCVLYCIKLWRRKSLTKFGLTPLDVRVPRLSQEEA